MSVKMMSSAAIRRNNQRRFAAGSVELFDEAGHCLGAVLMVRTDRLVGPGAETVYLRREAQLERLRQTA
jgi:hypothetical protein